MNSDQVILPPQRAAVVDDSASSVALMAKLLNSLGDCEPVGFTDSGEALTWCLVNEVDLVIVDYEMPAPNGIAFIEAFRKDSRNKSIPVVMVTSTEDRDIRYMALQIGATDFLTKPIDQVEFAARMRNLLASCRAHKSLAELSIWQANYDRLTGLPNRMLLLDRLDQAISSRDNSKAAVMHVDLARFKAINDTMGHDAGDEILRQVARRLASEQRQADTVARVGNDEFVIVLTEIGESHSPQTVAARICEKLQVPFQVGEIEVFISASIGIAIFPDDGTNTQQLLRSAAAAMPVAEEGGWRFFTPELDASARRHLSLETNLRHALVRNEFQLHYHPLVEVASGRILGAEALIRWRNAELGPVGPDDFIPIAEETGLIVPIGGWVIETICRDMAAWAAAGLPMLRIAANVSSRQLVGDGLLKVIADALARTGVPGHLIELEVTERMLLDKSPQTRSLLESLRDMGLRISIDDFGTGYSSMSYLTSFPFDVLKIDRSFVSRVTERRQDAALTQAIIAMAHSLDLEVVAEGVETPEQLLFLQGAGCEYAQGYLFTKPIPAMAFADLLGRTSSFTL